MGERQDGLTLYAAFGAITVRKADRVIAPDSAMIRGRRMTEHALLRNVDAGPEAVEAILAAAHEFAARWADTPEHVGVHPMVFEVIRDEVERLAKFMVVTMPRELHGGGRPKLFELQQSWALENDPRRCPDKGCSFPAGYCEAVRRAEMFHRSPEEWEWDRVAQVEWSRTKRGWVPAPPYFGPVRVMMSWLPFIKTITVGSTMINAEALRRLTKPLRWAAVVRFLGEMQIDVRLLENVAGFELRSTRVPDDDHERHLQAHRRLLDAIRRDAEIAAAALLLLGFDPQRMRAQDVADMESRAVQALESIDYPTPLQVAAHVAMQMMLPNAERLMAQADRETPAMRRRLYEVPAVMHPPRGFTYRGDPG